MPMQYNIMTHRNNNRGWRHLFGRKKKGTKINGWYYRKRSTNNILQSTIIKKRRTVYKMGSIYIGRGINLGGKIYRSIL